MDMLRSAITWPTGQSRWHNTTNKHRLLHHLTELVTSATLRCQWIYQNPVNVFTVCRATGKYWFPIIRPEPRGTISVRGYRLWNNSISLAGSPRTAPSLGSGRKRGFSRTYQNVITEISIWQDESSLTLTWHDAVIKQCEQFFKYPHVGYGKLIDIFQ